MGIMDFIKGELLRSSSGPTTLATRCRGGSPTTTRPSRMARSSSSGSRRWRAFATMRGSSWASRRMCCWPIRARRSPRWRGRRARFQSCSSELGSGGRRSRCELRAPRRQYHRFHSVRTIARRQVAGDLEGDRSRDGLAALMANPDTAILQGRLYIPAFESAAAHFPSRPSPRMSAAPARLKPPSPRSDSVLVAALSWCRNRSPRPIAS